CYVDDTVDGLIRMMNTPHEVSGPVNIGNPYEITVGELAERIQALVDADQHVEYLPLPQDDPQQRKPDISQARALLGWEPFTRLSEGLARTVSWFKEVYAQEPSVRLEEIEVAQ